MSRRMLKRGVPGMILAAALLIGSPGGAVEPARDFLNALRENGFHDMAVEYLDRLQNNPAVPVELKEVLLYERGVTLIGGASEQRDASLRSKQLDDAQAALEQFVQQRPQHPLAMSAKINLGDLLQQRATMLVDQGKMPGNQAKLPELLGQARGMYEEAFKVFDLAQEDLRVKLEGIPTVLDPKTQKDLIDSRDQMRRDYLQVQILAAAMKEEMANTAQEGSEDHTRLLTEAAAAYGDIYEKYRTRLAGLYARMYQGRCNQKLKKLVDALSFYAELLEQPDSPDAFRGLKTKTLLLAMQCWLDESQKKYAEAVAQGEAWVAKARPIEAQDPEWLQLRLLTAQAYKLYSDDLKKTAPKDPQVNRAISEARKLANDVARYPGDLQQEARKLLSQLRGGEATEEEQKPEPKTFAEAKDAGKEALDSLQTAGYVLRTIPAQLQKETDEAIKQELQQQIDEAQQKLATARDDARQYFQLALKYVDKDTPLEDVNVVRYFLCYLYYAQNDFYDAALMGEFLARRYPESSGARQSAKIAMASYLKLYAENTGPDKSFEIARTMGVADYIVQKWPQEEEAVDALNTLIPFAIQKGDLAAALEYLQKIPETSPKRGESELKTGQALWSAYLRGMSELREAASPDPAKEAELSTLKTQAQKTLADGIGRMKAVGNVDSVLTLAVLSLAQIYVDTEQADAAVLLLEGEPVQLLQLVGRKHPATLKEGFDQETYKTALRAYIAALAANPANREMIDKARQVMESLKQVVGDTAEGQRRLVAIYISLAQDLKKQIDLIDDPAAKKTLSEGFATFLEQVGGDSDELNVLNWVAETFAGMGEAFQGGQNPSPADSRVYFDKAAATYTAILEKGKQQAGWLSEDMRRQVQMRLAMTWRQIGKFDSAMNVLEEILVEKPLINVQAEAARTYQLWAELPEKEDLYERAIVGGRPDKKTKKNVVWGWGDLARKCADNMSRYPHLKDSFYEARYNLALSRFSHAMRKSNPQKRELVEKARRDIELTQKLYPDMGGETWFPKFDELMRRVQRELNEAVVGLGAAATASK
ncbi:MAG: hypothetical protein J5I93_01195 [Pirellulaceae bacterium]|nr:hypothetical protein [Pirellulaceae bacterium]